MRKLSQGDLRFACNERFEVRVFDVVRKSCRVFGTLQLAEARWGLRFMTIVSTLAGGPIWTLPIVLLGLELIDFKAEFSAYPLLAQTVER